MTDELPEIHHIAVRPSWDCLVCEFPWPCANAKEELLAEYQGLLTTLAIYMSVRMQDAIEDLTATGSHPPPDLYERFLSWTQLDSEAQLAEPKASPVADALTEPPAPPAAKARTTEPPAPEARNTEPPAPPVANS